MKRLCIDDGSEEFSLMAIIKVATRGYLFLPRFGNCNHSMFLVIWRRLILLHDIKYSTNVTNSVSVIIKNRARALKKAK